MVRHSSWILLATFLILLISVLIPEKSSMQRNQQDQMPTVTPVLFLGWSSGIVNGLLIKNSVKNETISLKRNHQGIWLLDISPNQTVDQGIGEELLSTLLSLKPLSILDKTLSPPDAFGLDTLYLSIKLTDFENRHITFRIGEVTPIIIKNRYYALIDKEHQYVISTNTVERLFELSTMKAITQE